MLRQLLQPAPEVLAQLVEDVGSRDVAADVGHSGEGHPVQAGLSGDFVDGDDAAQAEGAVGDELLESVPDHDGGGLGRVMRESYVLT